jgi:hypothetical protein
MALAVWDTKDLLEQRTIIKEVTGLMQHTTWLKGTFVPNKDYFFKQHLFHIVSNLIFIHLYFTWVSSS